MIALRPYQSEAIQAVRSRYKAGVTRPLISLPTGTGKTVVFGTIAKAAAERGNHVLILAHRDELIEQAQEKLLAIEPGMAPHIGVVKGRRDEWQKPITVASVQSLHERRRARITGRPWQVGIVDEAHHAPAETYQAILEHYGFLDDRLLIGVTATPQRADGADLGDTFQEIVFHRDILWMIREGYLCDLRGIQVKLSGLQMGRVKVRQGDYAAGALEDALTAAEAPHHAVGAWMKHASDRKRTLCFTPTVALAEDIAERFNAAGVRAANISAVAGDMAERRGLLRLFASGEIKVLTNALLLTEGFDEPQVDCILNCRPTKSKPLYVQIVGRGTRTYPGKDDCLVIDMVGASREHALMVLPSMFGLGADEADAAQDEIERDGIAQAMAQMPEIRQGKVTATRVDLFSRRQLHWNQVSEQCWVLSLGQGSDIHLDESKAGDWSVTLHDRDARRPQVMASGLTLGYAMGIAEEHLRTMSPEAQRLAGRNARWREKPASENQRRVLRRVGHPQAEQVNLTRGEAGDLVTVIIAKWAKRKAARR